MTQPINIVIPTRERADTLVHTLATAVAQDSDRVVIWVSDNASSPATREAVESFGDPRIRYLNTGERLSMSHNFEFALSHIDAGWISLIGDDDGLLPNRIEPVVKVLEESGLKALSSETCFYNWPGAIGEREAAMTVPLGSGTRVVDSRTTMADQLTLVRHKEKQPQTYTGGIVHTDVIKAVKSKKGAFFQSQIPDVYSGYAINAVEPQFLYSAAPFAILGRSRHSNGKALFNMRTTVFLDEGLIPFHADFPPSDFGTLAFSMPVLQYEAYCQTMFLHGGDPPISRQDMLAGILANTLVGRDYIEAWGRVFAAQHSLDFDAAMARAPALSRRIKAVNGWRAMQNLMRCARLYPGDPRPLGNISEASATAEAILRDPPSRIAETVKALTRRFA